MTGVAVVVVSWRGLVAAGMLWKLGGEALAVGAVASTKILALGVQSVLLVPVPVPGPGLTAAADVPSDPEHPRKPG